MSKRDDKANSTLRYRTMAYKDRLDEMGSFHMERRRGRGQIRIQKLLSEQCITILVHVRPQQTSEEETR